MTTSSGPMAWRWLPLTDVRAPGAALAFGPVARRLLARTAAAPAERLGSWTLTVSDDLLIIFGPGLPWADGVRYAAPHPVAPGLWLPTNEQPDAPPDLLWSALSRSVGREPLLIWPEPSRVVPLDRQVPITAALLQEISERWRRGRS